MEIRFTKEEDLVQLPFLYRQYHNGDTKIETDVEGMILKFKKLSKDENYKFISVVEQEKLVGYCSMVVNQDIVEKQKPIIMIWNLRVLPDYRKRGIGKKIMEFVESYGMSIGVDFVFLGCDYDNLGAKEFYTKIGYKKDYAFYKYL